jgi:hypothetical protein
VSSLKQYITTLGPVGNLLLMSPGDGDNGGGVARLTGRPPRQPRKRARSDEYDYGGEAEEGEDEGHEDEDAEVGALGDGEFDDDSGGRNARTTEEELATGALHMLANSAQKARSGGGSKRSGRPPGVPSPSAYTAPSPFGSNIMGAAAMDVASMQMLHQQMMLQQQQMFGGGDAPGTSRGSKAATGSHGSMGGMSGMGSPVGNPMMHNAMLQAAFLSNPAMLGLAPGMLGLDGQMGNPQFAALLAMQEQMLQQQGQEEQEGPYEDEGEDMGEGAGEGEDCGKGGEEAGQQQQQEFKAEGAALQGQQEGQGQQGQQKQEHGRGTAEAEPGPSGRSAQTSGSAEAGAAVHGEGVPEASTREGRDGQGEVGEEEEANAACSGAGEDAAPEAQAGPSHRERSRWPAERQAGTPSRTGGGGHDGGGDNDDRDSPRGMPDGGMGMGMMYGHFAPMSQAQLEAAMTESAMHQLGLGSLPMGNQLLLSQLMQLQGMDMQQVQAQAQSEAELAVAMAANGMGGMSPGMNGSWSAMLMGSAMGPPNGGGGGGPSFLSPGLTPMRGGSGRKGGRKGGGSADRQLMLQQYGDSDYMGMDMVVADDGGDEFGGSTPGKRPWTIEESEHLAQLVQLYGEGKWCWVARDW